MIKSCRRIVPAAVIAAFLTFGCAGSGSSGQTAADVNNDCETWTDIGCSYPLNRIQAQAERGDDVNEPVRSDGFWGHSKITGETSHKVKLMLLSHYRTAVEVRPVLAAALRHDADAVRWLVAHGANPAANVNLISDGRIIQKTGQDIAVFMNDLEALKILVDAADGELVLTEKYVAAMPCMDIEIARYILDKRAVFQDNGDPESPFPSIERAEDVELMSAAVAFDNRPLVEEFLSRGFSVDKRAGDTGNTMLMTAIQSDEIEMAKFLMDKGADVLAQNDEETSVLDMIMMHPNRSSLLEHLLPLGRIQLTAEQTFEYQLMPEGKKYHRLLIQYGASTDGCTCDGKSLLQIAIEHGDPDFLKVLLEAGSDVNARTPDGKTPLMLAVENENYHFAAALLEAGAHVDDCMVPVSETDSVPESDSDQKITPYGDEAVCSLTCNSPIPETTEADPSIPQNAQRPAVKAPEAPACVGKSALMRAVELQFADIVEVLLEVGAQVELTNSEGVNALNLAEQTANEAIIELLEGPKDENEEEIEEEIENESAE